MGAVGEARRGATLLGSISRYYHKTMRCFGVDFPDATGTLTPLTPLTPPPRTPHPRALLRSPLTPALFSALALSQALAFV